MEVKIFPRMEEQDAAIYRYVEAHAARNGQKNTLAALPKMWEIMSGAVELPGKRTDIPGNHYAYWRHSVAVCRMLIDLPGRVSHEEADILLASALCHVLPETFRLPDLKGLITGEMGLDERIYDTVMVLYRDDPLSDIQQRLYFERLRENKFALLIKLTDRSNLVEQLYSISGWSARSYIHETRTYFLPLCVYAKGRYHDMLAAVSVLMEKMRNLSEVAEILLSRYELRENALSQEILLLEEDNAGLRRMIQELEEEE